MPVLDSRRESFYLGLPLMIVIAFASGAGLLFGKPLAALVVMALAARQLGKIAGIYGTWMAAGACCLGALPELIPPFIDGLPEMFFSALLVGFIAWQAGREQVANDRAEHLARTDSLTGLLNRFGFEEFIQEHCRRNERIAVGILDGDRFKELNDRFGHFAGDKCLLLIASHIRRFADDDGAAARLGGDEFGIAIPLKADQEAMELEPLREALNAQENETPLAITWSMGVTESRPGDQGVHLLHRADQALLQAKQQGGNRTCIASPRSSTDPHPS